MSERFMAEALSLAASVHGAVGPNPRVGCVLVAADGTADSDGLCVIMTNAQAGSAVIEGALAQAKAAIDTENFTFIVMANGMAGSSPCSQETLADGLEQLLKKLGFQNSLKACS